MEGLQERYAEAKGTRLRYHVGGPGSPVALLHGFSGAASNWVGSTPTR